MKKQSGKSNNKNSNPSNMKNIRENPSGKINEKEEGLQKADSKKKSSKEESTDLKSEIISTVKSLVVAGVLVFLILTFVGQRTVVNGESMDYNLANGQSLIMEKVTYRFHDPERYDIVVFPGPQEMDGSEPYYIKRVIGLPGETVQIKDGKVYIDGEVLESDNYSISGSTDPGELTEEGIQLGEDEYFCLGDNRPGSYDCRYAEVGTVMKDEFIGKIWIRIWPLNEFGSIENKNADAN